MVGPGTGIAPFRAYLQQRDINSDKGRNWLFFGDWTEEGEYYYRDEMEDWKERGVIDRHDLAWSRAGDEKVYVQHLWQSTAKKSGIGLTAEPTFTSVEIRITWLKMYIQP